MTVPFTFGWEQLAVVVALVLLTGILAFVAMAAGRASSGRSEWQAWLDGRSAAPVELGSHERPVLAQSAHPTEE
jgi:hypothetical protein